MARKLRIAAAVLFFISITLLFLDFTGTLHAYLGWTARVQFIPAILSLNIAVLAVLILITLLLGRVYCSVICPLGIFQDVISRITGIRKKDRFSWRPPCKKLVITRFTLLAVFALSLIIGISLITVTLEPYSAYGRMVSQILSPVYLWGNNILAYFAERADSYAFYSVDIWLKSLSALVMAILTFVIVGVFAWKSGRGYCNTICPVGAFLGIFAKYAAIKPRINKEACSKCGICAKNCKAGCIDPVNKEVDSLRCVSCFNCESHCPKGAITYGTKGKANMVKEDKLKDDKLTNEGSARRSLISGTALLATGFLARSVHGYDFDGGLAPLEDKIAPDRSVPIIPPGAFNARNFNRHCTGCQLCVTGCPNQVLRPSNSLHGFMQPHLSFERGYCRPECVRCSEVCPTGAISPITAAEKSATQIGIAVWNKDHCIVIKDNVPCDLCEYKCPTGAITLIEQSANGTDSTLPKIPMIDTNRCIGCGACEHLCPARPLSAIHVEGIDSHRTI